jgi:hypothetical protein
MADEELKIIIITLLCSLIILGLAITILFLIEKYKKGLYKSTQKIELLKLDFEKKILETQLEIQETTFNQISSEIHDNISLGLTLSKLQITNYLDKKEENYEKLHKCEK